MKITTRTRYLQLLALLLALPFLVQAATPSPSSSHLDKRLAPIAVAAAAHADTRLRDAALARQANHLNSPLEARWNAAGEVQVYLHYDPATAAPDREQLEALGVTDILYSPRMGVVQAWVPAVQLTAVAELPGVRRLGLPHYALPKRAPVLGARTYTGSVVTQGDTLLQAAAFRSATGVTGQGITVGVISDGDDHISSSQSTGDLPMNIMNDPNDAGSFHSSGDEGTAMMEIVYDIAPGVKQLGFCGPSTDVEFVTCLDDFQSNISANVIVDDLGFPGFTAMFSQDSFTTGVANFASANPSVRLVTAAGNDGTGFWGGDWNPMAVTTSVNSVPYTQAQNFNTSGGSTLYLTLTVQTGDTINYVVQWADPWDDTSTTNDPNDYDVVVFDNSGLDGSGTTAGHRAVACNQGINVGPVSPSTLCNQNNTSPLNTPGPTPVQGSTWTATQSTYYLAVFFKNGTPSNHLKILVFDNSAVQVGVSPGTVGSIFGQSALAYPTEITAGAVFWSNQNLESFSSTGPVQTGTSGSLTPVMKPDFVAPDCVNVTGAGGFTTDFCGTSAAAPHIAGLVALLMSGYPSQSPYTLLQTSATPKGSPVPNGKFGYGLPDMQTLLNASDFPVPTSTIVTPTDGASVKSGTATNFVGSCIDLASSISYDWNFGASGIPDATSATPSVTFQKAGSYTVTLNCTTSTTTVKSSITVTVTTPPSSGGGGGSTDLLSLLALGLAALRRRRTS